MGLIALVFCLSSFKGMALSVNKIQYSQNTPVVKQNTVILTDNQRANLNNFKVVLKKFKDENQTFNLDELRKAEKSDENYSELNVKCKDATLGILEASKELLKSFDMFNAAVEEFGSENDPRIIGLGIFVFMGGEIDLNNENPSAESLDEGNGAFECFLKATGMGAGMDWIKNGITATIKKYGAKAVVKFLAPIVGELLSWVGAVIALITFGCCYFGC